MFRHRDDKPPHPQHKFHILPGESTRARPPFSVGARVMVSKIGIRQPVFPVGGVRLERGLPRPRVLPAVPPLSAQRSLPVIGHFHIHQRRSVRGLGRTHLHHHDFPRHRIRDPHLSSPTVNRHVCIAFLAVWASWSAYRPIQNDVIDLAYRPARAHDRFQCRIRGCLILDHEMAVTVDRRPDVAVAELQRGQCWTHAGPQHHRCGDMP